MLQLYKLSNTDITTLENEKKALEEKNNQLENKVVLLENEVKSFVPTFFGRYKKVKA